jgi:hypothetical protein
LHSESDIMTLSAVLLVLGYRTFYLFNVFDIFTIALTSVYVAQRQSYHRQYARNETQI